MSAELVGGAFLSASLQVLFDRLASQELVDLINGKRPFDRLLKNLKIKLLSANMVLNDAEEKQIRNPSVKKWLDELKDTIFDAEDLTAEIKFQALECKMGGGSFSRSGTSQVMKLIPSPFWGFDKGMKSKLFEILELERLDFILKQKDMLKLKVGVDCRRTLVRLSTTLARESSVFGGCVDKEAIVRLLLDDDVGGYKIYVVGMGGIVTRTTLETITSSPCKMKDPQMLQVVNFVPVNKLLFTPSRIQSKQWNFMQELAGYPKDIFDSMLRYPSFVMLVSARHLPAKEFPHLCQTSIS
ncbi:hypothetical protein TIFTF001_033222 [Ficus carica]|uniref:Disease resistance N-terminal domain-containing protein n=1 Tax=Ficus carica TaxID=3494 RepID=A0AA88J7L3_FICCA|nr:hypothetical protein TIFTF001_033222 [Ficus carica]